MMFLISAGGKVDEVTGFDFRDGTLELIEKLGAYLIVVSY